MKFQVKNGATDVSLLVYIQATDGTALTTLTFGSASLRIYYSKGGAGTVTSVTPVTQTSTGAHSDGGFVAKDSTNMPGVYRVDLPDAAFTGTHQSTVVTISGVTGMLPCSAEVAMVDFVPTASTTEHADALLNRDMTTGTDSGSTTVRTVRQALRFLRNRWTISTGTLTVYKEDDTTSSWTSALSTTPTADVIIGSDPAG